jgi:putative hydrolase of the HAD superfamily
MTADGVRAVLFDLDDTLFEQATWLRGAWSAVAVAGATEGVDPNTLRAALLRVCAEGSHRGDIIDRALARIGRTDVAVAPLLAAFRAHAPARLLPYPGVLAALDRLQGQVQIGLVSDGDPAIQRSKLRALGIERCFDIVVFGDELGREHRKPSPVGLLTALVGLAIDANGAVYVGDRPDTDVAAANAAGMRAIRVRSGEYAHRPDAPQPWATAPDVATAVDGLLELSLVTTR